MELPSYFIDFLSEIRLTQNQVDDLIKGHRTLRERLNNYGGLSDIILSTFLQGSYKRATAVRPKGDNRSDVDVVIVTNLDINNHTPDEALNLFKPFLDKYYKGKFRIQGRSLGIYMTYVDLDIVVTSTPIENEELMKNIEELSDLTIEDIYMKPSTSLVKSNFLETFAEKSDSPKWKTVPLFIPDREAEDWKPTHPLEQIRWTIEKNSITKGHYVNVVKALKWWRKENHPDLHPKSYPLEHFIGDCCPDDISSVADGIIRTLENIVSIEEKPELKDRGVEDHDVFERITDEEYENFHSEVRKAAIIARHALNSTDIRESALKWKELFGSKFPDPPQTNKNGGFTQRTEKTKDVPRGRFA